MDLSLLLLATFAQEWSKWFFIGLAIGIPLVIVAAVITYFQTKNDAKQAVSEMTLNEHTEDYND